MQDILTLAAELRGRGEPFALLPKMQAITLELIMLGILGDGHVLLEALAALRDGQPRLVVLVGDGGRDPTRTEGIVHFPMTCHSGGTLEIYVEPFLPKALLILVGHGPVIETLATLAETAGHAVRVLPADAVAADLRGGLALGPTAAVVVATHGDDDETALTAVLGDFMARRTAYKIASATTAPTIASRIGRFMGNWN